MKTFQFTTIKGERREVPAYYSGPFAIYRIRPDADAWRVCHRQSERLVCSDAATLNKARQLVRTIGPLLDWNTADPAEIEKRARPNFGAIVAAIRESRV